MTADRDRSDTLGALLADLAERVPERSALIDGASAISFAGLEARSRRVASGLAGLGVGAGDRVALWLPNAPAYPILYFACARLGAVAVAVNTRFRAVELADLVGRTRAKVLAYWPGFKHIDFAGTLARADAGALDALESLVIYADEAGAEPTDAALPGRRVVAFRELEAAPAWRGAPADADSPCNIFASSGTTRAPKLIVHSQRTITRHARAVAARLRFDAAGARSLQMIPLSGIFGFSQMMGALAGGCPTVLMTGFDAQWAAELIARHAITHLIGTDLLYRRLLDARGGPRPYPSVRLAGFAAFTPSITDLIAQGDARGIPFVGLYGSSEVQALFAAQAPGAPPALRAKAGGTPVSPEARVRVRDLDSGALLADGQAGELELAGPGRMTGYLDDPAAMRAAITEDGFLRTGDLGYTEPGGRFVFLSRRGDLLRLGGFLVHPAEIEAHIQAHPSVEGCQVVGVERPEGMRAVAFVTTRRPGDFDARALRSHCLQGLAKYKLPERFIRLDAFPMTQGPNGMKVQRAKLRGMAAGRA